MQTQIEKALNDIASELHEIRKLLEKDMKAPVKGMIDENNQITFLNKNKPWWPFDIVSTNLAFDILPNNPEAHDWRIAERDFPKEGKDAGKPLEEISNNPEAHGWCQDEQG